MSTVRRLLTIVVAADVITATATTATALAAWKPEITAGAAKVKEKIAKKPSK